MAEILSGYIEGIREDHKRRQAALDAKVLQGRLSRLAWEKKGEVLKSPDYIEWLELVDRIASRFHEDWQKTSGYKERWKPFFMDRCTSEVREKDEALWARLLKEGKRCGVNKDGRTIDIQNTCYHDLPFRWNQENQKAAVFIIDLLFDGGAIDGNFGSAGFLEEKAEKVNEAWIERNGDENTPRYKKLDEHNRNKDRRHVIIALEEYLKLKAEGKYDIKKIDPQGLQTERELLNQMLAGVLVK